MTDQPSAPSPAEAITAAIAIPEDWELVDESGEDTVELIAREPERTGVPDSFRANLVVTRSDAVGASFADWQNSTDEALSELLADYVPIDLERLYFDDHEGGRRLAHYRSEDGRVLTMEQWFVLIDGDGHTLTFTIDTPRYDAWADVFSEIAGGWEPRVDLNGEKA